MVYDGAFIAEAFSGTFPFFPETNKNTVKFFSVEGKKG